MVFPMISDEIVHGSEVTGPCDFVCSSIGFFDETRFCQLTLILNNFVYFAKGFRRNTLRTVPFSVSVDFVVFLTVFRRNVTSFFDHDSDLRHGPIRPLPNGFSTKRGPCNPPPDVILSDASSSVFPKDFVRTHSYGHTSEQSKNGITFRLFFHWFFDEMKSILMDSC